MFEENLKVAIDSWTYIISYEGFLVKVIIDKRYRVTVLNQKDVKELVFLSSRPEMLFKMSVVLQRAYVLAKDLQRRSGKYAFV